MNNYEMIYLLVAGSMFMGIGLGITIGVLLAQKEIALTKIHRAAQIIVLLGFFTWTLRNNNFRVMNSFIILKDERRTVKKVLYDLQKLYTLSNKIAV